MSKQNKLKFTGRVGGQVVSVLTLLHRLSGSYPAQVYSFSVQFVFENRENKEKEARVGSFSKYPVKLAS